MSGEDLRSRYEVAVSGLRAQVAAMRQVGASAEEIALAVYGDPIGPSIEHLRALGKSWDEIIDSAARPRPLLSSA